MNFLSELHNLDEFDVVIIGAGPTGLITTYEAIRKGLKVLMIDQGEFRNPDYSAISKHWDQHGEKRLGGIGGTANAWMGQSLRFSKTFFEHLFANDRSWDFSTYLKYALEVEKVVGVQVSPSNCWSGNRRLQKNIIFTAGIRIQNSFMPIEQRWSKIFSKTLRSSNLSFFICHVDSLILAQDQIGGLRTSKGDFSFSKSNGIFILSANTICNSRILEATNAKSNAEVFLNLSASIYDHPFRTKLFFDGCGSRWLQRNTFTYTLKSLFRTKVKDKFVVELNENEIGVFELRPEYQLNLIGKIVNRFSLSIFGYSPFRASKIGIWVQIAQELRQESSPSSTQISWADQVRFAYIENSAREFMKSNGYVELKTEPDEVEFSQAFHPSGSIKAGFDFEKYSFAPDGKSLVFKNLLLTGGAIIENGSWFNPTLPIMTIALKAAREIIKSKD